MNRFNFSLQKLLELRGWRERQRALEMARAKQIADHAAAAEAALHEQQLRSMQTCAHTQENGVAAGALQNLWESMNRMAQHAAAAEQVRVQAEATLEQRVAELRIALTDRRILDRLRAVHLQSWREDQSRADRKTMDGIATDKFIRRQAGDSPAVET